MYSCISIVLIPGIITYNSQNVAVLLKDYNCIVQIPSLHVQAFWLIKRNRLLRQNAPCSRNLWKKWMRSAWSARRARGRRPCPPKLTSESRTSIFHLQCWLVIFGAQGLRARRAKTDHSGTIHFLLRQRRYGAFWRSCTTYKIEFYREMYTSFQKTTTSRPFTYNLHTNLRRTPECRPRSRALEDPKYADPVNELWIHDYTNWSPVLVQNT